MAFRRQEFENYITVNLKIKNEYFENIINDYPENIYVLIFYSFFLFKNEKIEKARKIFNSIKNPEDFYSYYVMVDALINYEKDFTSKKIKLLESIKIDKKNKWAYLELFYLLKDTDENYIAWDYLEKSISIDYNFFEAKFQRILYYDSIQNCKLIIEEILTFPQTYVDENILNCLAYAYFNNYEFINAKKIALGSLDIYASKDAYYLLGLISYEFENDFKIAFNYFQESLNIDCKQSKVLTSKGWLLFDMGKLEYSKNVFKELIEIDRSQFSYNQLIQFYFECKDFDEAIKYIDSSKELFGNNYMNDGFYILYTYKKNYKKLLEAKIKEYKKVYTSDQISWLKEILNNIGR
jgi:pentatricopeptide repeat protein